MENIIQCPTCSKKYKLKGTPPPTFQCRQCNTVMDLSMYAQPQTPAAPAGGAPQAARGGAAPSPRRGGSGRRRPNAAAGRHRRGRQEEAYDDGGDEGRPRYQRKQGNNNVLIFGSLGGLVVAAILLFVALKDQPEPQPEKPKETVQAPPPVMPDEGPDEPEEEVKKEAPKVAPGREDETRPELTNAGFDSVPIPEGKRKYRYSQAEIKTYPWPDYVTGEERAQIEKWIEALQWGGADGRDAADALVAMDARNEDGTLKPGEQFKAVGRLISEFRNTLDRGENQYTPDTLAMLSQIDKILRQIDGFIERVYNDRRPIHFQSTDKEAELTMKRWNWWYDLEKWHLRNEPWNEAEDLADPETMEGDDWADDGE